MEDIMEDQKPLCIITEKQALGIIDCLTTMHECFNSVVSNDDSEMTKLFLNAKSQIQTILSSSIVRKEKGVGSEIRDKRMQEYWKSKKANH